MRVSESLYFWRRYSKRSPAGSVLWLLKRTAVLEQQKRSESKKRKILRMEILKERSYENTRRSRWNNY
jgi:hypothetical protein